MKLSKIEAKLAVTAYNRLSDLFMQQLSKIWSRDRVTSVTGSESSRNLDPQSLKPHERARVRYANT